MQPLCYVCFIQKDNVTLEGVLGSGVVGYSQFVQEGFGANLMHLQAEVPGVIAEDKAGYLLVGEDRDSMTVFPVGLACHLRNYVLPSVKEVWAAGTVGYYHIRFVGLHAFKFLVGV